MLTHKGFLWLSHLFIEFFYLFCVARFGFKLAERFHMDPNSIPLCWSKTILFLVYLTLEHTHVQQILEILVIFIAQS